MRSCYVVGSILIMSGGVASWKIDFVVYVYTMVHLFNVYLQNDEWAFVQYSISMLMTVDQPFLVSGRSKNVL